MDVLYVDESGGGEPPSSDRSATPVFAMAGVIIPSEKLKEVTRAFVSLKVKYFPNARNGRKSLDLILNEIKGTALLKAYREPSRDRRRHAMQFVGEFLSLMEDFDLVALGKA